MKIPRSQRLALLSIACACLVAARDLFAALSLTTSSNSVSMPFAATDYNSATGAAQSIKTAAHTLTVLSTSSTFTLSMRAQTATFTFTPSSGDANPNKPAGDLAVRAPLASLTWIPLSTTSQVLGTGPKSNSSQSGALDYRLNSNLATNPPGTYSLSVIYTLTSP
jgi:hypothetical protein